jgi:hypothetical protein
MRATTLFLFAVVVPTICTFARAQVFDLSAGVSTLYGAEGASVIIHGSKSETSLGAGLINGHFGVGAASSTKYRGGLLTTGQQQLSMELPTDIFGGGQILSGTGVAFRTAPGTARGYTAFAGLSSSMEGTPLFQTNTFNSPAAYLQLRQRISDSFTAFSTAVISPNIGGALLESVSWKYSSKLGYAFTGGIGGRDPYAAVSLQYKGRKSILQASYVLAGNGFQRDTDPELTIAEPIHENVSAEYHLTRSLSISGVHRNYFIALTSEHDLKPVSSVHSALDEVGMECHHGSTIFDLSLLHSSAKQQASTASTASSGLAVSFAHKFGKIDWTETFYDTIQPQRNQTAVLINGVALNLNPHLRLIDSVNVTSQNPSFSHGGALLTSFSSFEVDYQVLYLAAKAGNPFQQAMVFDAHVRVLRDLWMQASSSVGPTGKTLYTFQLTKQLIRNVTGNELVAPTSLGDSVIRGRVVDEQGLPVEGAVILIDAKPLYTDSKGFFLLREKAVHIHPLSVATADFMQVGAYEVVKAPQFVSSSVERNTQPITIIVRRQPTNPTSRRLLGESLSVGLP